MGSWTVRRRIIASFAVVIGLMVVLGGFVYTRLARIEGEMISLQTDSLPGFSYATEIRAAAIMDYALTEEYVIESEKAGLPEIGARIQAERAKLEQLIKDYEATIFQAKDRQNFEAFKTSRRSYLITQEAILKLGSENRTQEMLVLMRSRLKPAFDNIRLALQTAIEFNKVGADMSAQRSVSAVTTTEDGILVGIVLAFLLSVVTGYYLLAAITRPLGRLGAAMNVMREGDFNSASWRASTRRVWDLG